MKEKYKKSIEAIVSILLMLLLLLGCGYMWWLEDKHKTQTKYEKINNSLEKEKITEN